MDSESIYDIIIVGSGVAGLTAALESGDKRVLVVTKTDSFASGSSPLAQGGIAASVGSDDSPSLHYKDTVKAGVYSSRSEQVSFLTENGANAIDSLIKLNMEFDKTVSGGLDRNREGAHSRRRVLKAGGDATGRVLVQTLYSEAVRRKNIKWATSTFVVDLDLVDGCVSGVVAYSKEFGHHTIKSSRVLLATGGLGQLFGHTTNPVEATGDSMAIAIRSGVKLKEIEMVQFHPTALNVKVGDSLMLLTEALRGDGATLVREDGLAFMDSYSKLKDLAPRDIVSRAIWNEISIGNKVYLDLKAIMDIEKKFPTVYSFCVKSGFDPRTDLIPVTPAVHYVMGGVDINSDLPLGLGVAGEAAYTGVHGANRLASNSLLECLVYGKSEANRLFELTDRSVGVGVKPDGLSNLPSLERIKSLKLELQNIMYKFCGIIRNNELLECGKVKLSELNEAILSVEEFEIEMPGYSHVISWLELKNMVLLGQELIDSALKRTESRGAHFRDDFPETNIKWNRIKE